METAYSTLAIKYVGSTRASVGLDQLRRVQAERNATFNRAMAVTRSTGGELHYYAMQGVPTRRITSLMAAAGLVCGFLLRRRFGWTAFCAALGALLGWFFALVKREELAAIAPYVAKNESMLYLQIRDANWPEFWRELAPILDPGRMVLCTIAPRHVELRRLLELGQGNDGESAKTGITRELVRDDFTRLRGIGPVTRRRLYEGGVLTFAQLAAMQPEAIAKLAGVPLSRALSYAWTEQAEEQIAAEQA